MLPVLLGTELDVGGKVTRSLEVQVWHGLKPMLPVLLGTELDVWGKVARSLKVQVWHGLG